MPVPHRSTEPAAPDTLVDFHTGGDCCENTCIDGDTHTCGSYDCKDPDAPPVPDPYYPDAAWC